jgi:DNA topoisomerase-1
MTPETVSLEDALRLLTLPRTLGEVDGEEVIVTNGRYGPYVKRGKESRSLETEEEMFTVTLEQALAKLAEPKQRGRRAAAPPLKELGEDPVSKQPVVLKEGRFGPYVTDGATNASLRAGDSVESITPERAAELLQERRERGPVKKKRAPKKRS